MKPIEKLLLAFCSIILIVLTLLFFYFYDHNWWKEYEQVNVLPNSSPSHSNAEDSSSPAFIDKSGEAQKELSISSKRKNYQNGQLTLIIPSINLDEKVQDGTSQTSLALGPGLYEYAQLPNEKFSNVSIAAHRNKSRNGIIKEWFFYYIDQLQEGNHFYLIYENKIYQYIYTRTSIVTPDDWSPIYSQGFNCITLTSCEPIGIASHRIVVQGKLEKVIDYSGTFEFLK